MKVSRILRVLCGAAMLLLGTVPALANVIVPGGCVGGLCAGTLNVFSNTPGTLLASATDSRWTAYDASGVARYSGVLRAEVYRNSGGMLDFYYQFSNSGGSLDSVGRLTMTDFGGFTTDVGYRMDNWDGVGQFLAANQAPVSADRSGGAGGTVGFTFAGMSGKVDPGEISATVIIRTNATAYKAGSLTTQNGAVYTTAAFAPTASSVPEPGTYAMLGGGLIAMALLRRRK